jgi:membrane associated rhomboid family serine protease/Flp pilus assembly protein TadD
MGLTQIFFGANVAVFLGMALASSSIGDFPTPLLLAWGANVGPYTLFGEWWRLVTYMFLHGSLIHIAFNMWGLWTLGQLCESLYGRWTFAAVYIITGIGGGLASVAWNPGVVSVGASGAIFGLVGALIASLSLGEFSIPGLAIKGVVRSLVIVGGFNLLYGSMNSGIDNACHVGGLLTGLVLGGLVALVAPLQDAAVKRASIILLVALAMAGSAAGVQHWRGFPLHFGRATFSSDASADRMISQLQKKVAQSPQDASAHNALAHAYFSKNEIPQGIAELNRVLELQPQNTTVRIALGGAYLSQEQPKDAQEAFTKVLAQQPGNAEAHVGLGLALADQQQHQAAIEEYKTAMKLGAKADGMDYRMGISQYHLNQYDDAIASFFKERERSGDQYVLEIALAEAFEAKGMTSQAQEARRKAEKLRDED